MPNADESLICPYDKTHVISAKGFNAHLIRCRKNHKDSKMEVCRFNKIHLVPQPEMSYHLSQCPSRYLLDRSMQKLSETVGGQTRLMGKVDSPAISNHLENDEDEWDLDPSCHGMGLFNKVRNERQDDGKCPYDPREEHFDGGSSLMMDSSAYRQGVGGETTFRTVPNTQSAASRLVSPPVTRPGPAASSRVFQYSINQTMAGTGVGRGQGFQPSQTGGAMPVAGRGVGGPKKSSIAIVSNWLSQKKANDEAALKSFNPEMTED